MTTGTHATRTNRGPAAAAANRRALLDSARRLFAERGYDVPLSAIARDAGVGQGSLYRHFPTRLDLAFAIFEDNYAELERIATEDRGAGSFGRFWRRLIELTLASTAFVELAVEARRELTDSDHGERVVRVLEDPLARAQAAGEIDAAWTAADLALIHRMAYGVIVTEVDADAARRSARRALALVDPVLSWQEPEESP